jgi:hypothetical protein
MVVPFAAKMIRASHADFLDSIAVTVEKRVKNAMASIPVDILRNILEHIDRAGLVKMCLLNKICCSCSQDVLYRDIICKDNRICRTLVNSSQLARRVRSFLLYAHDEELANVLQNMTSLRSLTLGDGGSVASLMD